MPEITTTLVTSPDLTEIRSAQEPLLLRAREIIISNVAEQSVALELLRDIRTGIKSAKAKFKTIKDPMNALKKAVDALEHEVIDPWEAAESRLSTANSNFILEEKRKAEKLAAEEAARKREQLRIEAQKKADEERAERERIALEQAEQLESEGYAGAADATLEAAIAVEPAPIVVPEVYVRPEPVAVARVAGISSRVNYSCEVTDLKVLVDWCLENPAMLGLYVVADATALNQRARQSKEQFNIPGCKLITKYV